MIARIGAFLILSSLLGACAVTTRSGAPEYSREYVLAADTKVWTDCHLFTGGYSLNMGGPETAHCVVSERYNSPPLLSAERLEADKKRMVILKKGSSVRIERIFTVTHQGVSTAELLIADHESGATRRVFAPFWPTETPNLLRAR